tara:strand:- start:479 stop:853 length:375 start_codon:yes stop_codon:yes gene_type:complete
MEETSPVMRHRMNTHPQMGRLHARRTKGRKASFAICSHLQGFQWHVADTAESRKRNHGGHIDHRQHHDRGEAHGAALVEPLLMLLAAELLQVIVQGFLLPWRDGLVVGVHGTTDVTRGEQEERN